MALNSQKRWCPTWAVPDWASCCARCGKTDGCASWTYVPGEKACWLKDKPAPAGDGDFSWGKRVMGLVSGSGTKREFMPTVIPADVASSGAHADEGYRTARANLRARHSKREL